MKIIILDGRDINFFHFLRAMDVCITINVFTKTWKCSTNVWKRNFKVTLFRHISLEDILINWIGVRITIDARCFLLFFIRHKCVFCWDLFTGATTISAKLSGYLSWLYLCLKVIGRWKFNAQCFDRVLNYYTVC